MKTSPTISNLTKALLTAQKQMGAAVKGSKNPFFKSSYADLPTVMEVMKEPLNEAGIIVLQPPSNRDGKNFITTVLIHADTGEFIESETEVVCAKQNDPQAFGAAQTYARRFGLQAMGFIPAEDDDGNTAAGRTADPVKYKPTPTPTKAAVTTPVVPKTMTETGPRVTQPSGETTTSVTLGATGQTVTATVLEPLKKSSFHKKPKTTTTTAPAAADSEWS